jgi:putative oxidoreductase
MSAVWRGPVAVVGRIFLALIFFTSAVGNKIPNFGQTVEYMAAAGVPAPRILLPGAILFLIAGSVSLVFGYRARIGAALLAVFLVSASYYFHDFWNLPAGSAEAQTETIAFMKNLGLVGAMLLVIANGPGPMSLDAVREKKAKK